MLSAYPDGNVPTTAELMKRGFVFAPPAPVGMCFRHVPTVEELTDKLMSLSAGEYCKYALDTGIRTEIARLQYAKCVRE